MLKVRSGGRYCGLQCCLWCCVQCLLQCCYLRLSRFTSFTDALTKGAVALTGHGAGDRDGTDFVDGGHFLAPTVLGGATSDMREVAETFEDQEGEEGEEGEEKESELKTRREKRQRIAAAS